ncbi:glycosyltransferase family 4 protein [Flavobacterium johnsoniae]|uniref:Glycosyl transferase 4-like n=1 Tax=Flavobacterium johnsoniae TaxID=986 RepID=A0A1M5L3T3_FLAJO|nr:glycosyltransferase family 4 protein [Flavobacterium johnsoniae]SHG59677.1 Glycosyl transferase 4-like [Flavobacterium johnsoniae]
MEKYKLVRVATVPVSLNILLKGQLRFLNRYFDVTAVSSKGNDLSVVSEREGVSVYSIDIKRNISIFSDFISLLKMYIYLRKTKPSIVHSITPKAGLISMVASKMAGVPIRMHTFTGLIFPTEVGVKRYILIAMDRLLCLCATNIYPEGEGVKNDLKSYKITKKSLKVIANGNVNGVDVDFFDRKNISVEEQEKLKKELKILKDDFVFVFVGRLVKDKGINELVKAFSKLSLESKNVHLILVGEKEVELSPLEKETLSIMNNHSHIHEVGFQSDIRPYMAISNAFVFASYREGFPNVILQAGAMELPCIVTDINGANEIIIDKKNGCIVPSKNVNVLIEKMKLFIKDGELLEQLSKNSRSIIVKSFQQHFVWDCLLDEYKKLLHDIQ